MEFSDLRLFENDFELGPAHSAHIDIAESGAGRFSHWNGTLYFSSSDGSSPCTNAKKYRVLVTEPSEKCLPSFNAFVSSFEEFVGVAKRDYVLHIQRGRLLQVSVRFGPLPAPYMEAKTAHDYRVWYCAEAVVRSGLPTNSRILALVAKFIPLISYR